MVDSNTEFHKATCERRLRTITEETWVPLTSFFQRDSTYFPADRAKITEHEIEHRYQTKPTNIGMAIVSLLGAERIGHLSDRQVDYVIETIIDNLKNLKRHEGFFLDWYDSRTGEVLTHWPGADETIDKSKPSRLKQFVSSVDNAWLAAALLTAQKAKPHLAEKIQEILDQMDFEFFFDEEAQEVRGGYDVGAKKFDRFHYPRHKISEPRIITWVNAALKKNPEERKEILSRLLDREGRIPNELAGGAMFELLMPRLFVRERYLDERIETFVKKHLESGRVGRSVGDDPNLPGFPYIENGFAGDYPPREFITSHGIALLLSVFPEEAIRELMRAKTAYNGFYREGFGFMDSYSPETDRSTTTKVFVNEAMVFLSLLNYLEDNYFVNAFEQHFTEEELNTGCSAAQMEQEINELFVFE